MRIPAVLPVLLVLAAPAVAHASDVYVNPALGCSDSASATVASSPSTPWCSLAPACRLARPGDVVHVAACDLRGAVPPRRLGHDGCADRVQGRRRRHDLGSGRHRERHARGRPRRRSARHDRARFGASGRLGRHVLARHARRGHRDQQRRRGRADQGRHLGHGHELAAGRQCARGLHGNGTGRRHDAQQVHGDGQRQGRPAVQRRRRRAQRHGRLRGRRHDQRQRRRCGLRARHLRGPDCERLPDRPQRDRQQRGRRRQGRRWARRDRGQPPHLLDVRARDLRQPGVRDRRSTTSSRGASSTGS